MFVSEPPTAPPPADPEREHRRSLVLVLAPVVVGPVVQLVCDGLRKLLKIDPPSSGLTSGKEG